MVMQIREYISQLFIAELAPFFLAPEFRKFFILKYFGPFGLCVSIGIDFRFGSFDCSAF